MKQRWDCISATSHGSGLSRAEPILYNGTYWRKGDASKVPLEKVTCSTRGVLHLKTGEWSKFPNSCNLEMFIVFSIWNMHTCGENVIMVFGHLNKTLWTGKLTHNKHFSSSGGCKSKINLLAVLVSPRIHFLVHRWRHLTTSSQGGRGLLTPWDLSKGTNPILEDSILRT